MITSTTPAIMNRSHIFISASCKNVIQRQEVRVASKGAEQLLWFSVFRIEVQLNFPARALFRRIDHARIKRARVNMQADRSLIKLARVDYAMDGIGWIDGTRLRDIHLHSVER